MACDQALPYERELQSREAVEQPLAAQREARTRALQRVTDAKEAKKKADDAAITQAALPGCKKNWAQLLTDAVHDAKTELTNAEAALALLPRHLSSTALADRISVPRWIWDLIMAGLLGLAVVGGSIAFALAVHPRRHTTIRAASASVPVEIETKRREAAQATFVKQPARPRVRPRRALGSTPRALGSSPLAITARPLKHQVRVTLNAELGTFTAWLRLLHFAICREQVQNVSA